MTDTSPRSVLLFRDGGYQAIRLPAEYELPGQNAMIRREGRKLIIEPVSPPNLLDFLKGLEPVDEEFPEIDDPPPEPVDIF